LAFLFSAFCFFFSASRAFFVRRGLRPLFLGLLPVGLDLLLLRMELGPVCLELLLVGIELRLVRLDDGRIGTHRLVPAQLLLVGVHGRTPGGNGRRRWRSRLCRGGLGHHTGGKEPGDQGSDGQSLEIHVAPRKESCTPRLGYDPMPTA
jgi:hypothetical protein